MARSETDLFVTKILGEEKGWVSVAYKQGETVWKERQFEWPAKRDELKAWATKHAKTGDVFICPAVRIKKRRHKGDGKGLLWLWADVDMEKIPSKRHDLIKKRIAKLGTVIVSSGSGDNVHVYVRLQHEVTATEHEILNTGLRDYLGADNKQADNSLLRLPGTLNHKPANKGKAVQIKGGTRKSVDPEKLMAMQVWQSVKIEASGVASGEWAKVDITKILKGGVKAHARMRVEEAKARFGTRHKAVYAVTQWLIKRGFSSDEIHSLMDEFPAAVEKNEDEHGGYDVHKDIARVMTQQPTADVVKGVMADDEPESEEIPERVLDIMREDDYRRRAKQLIAQRTFTPPPDEAVSTIAHSFTHPPRPVKHLIQGLAGAKHNVTITGQYKTGKTQFMMDLSRCLVDRVPFLEQFETLLPDNSTVGIWSLEMDEQELIDDYLRPLGIENPEQIWAYHGQGLSVNILTDVGKQYAVNMLQSRRTKVWMIDSMARLARQCGVSENNNEEMLDMFAAIDEIKKRADVDACFLITHTGRGEMVEGEERARGATAIDDWAGARWLLTKDSGIRLFSVPNSRGVELEQTSLHFDRETKRSSAGITGISKAMVRTEMGIEGAVTVASKAIEASDQNRVQQVLLLKLFKQAGLGSNRNQLLDLLNDAVESGRIVESSEKSDKGRAGKFYRLPSSGTRVIDFGAMPKPRRKR